MFAEGVGGQVVGDEVLAGQRGDDRGAGKLCKRCYAAYVVVVAVGADDDIAAFLGPRVEGCVVV